MVESQELALNLKTLERRKVSQFEVATWSELVEGKSLEVRQVFKCNALTL